MEGRWRDPRDFNRYLGRTLTALSHDDRLSIVLTFGVVSTAMLGRWIDAAWLNSIFRFLGAYGVLGLLAVWFNGRTRHLTTPRFQQHLGLYLCFLYFVAPAACAGIFFFSPFEERAWVARGALWLGYTVPTFLASLWYERYLTPRRSPQPVSK